MSDKIPSFIVTELRTGTRVALNLNHVENVYEDDNGDAVFVMLPTPDGTRVFETTRSFDDTLAAYRE